MNEFTIFLEDIMSNSDVLSDDDNRLLSLTSKTRETIIKKLTENDKIPDDKDEIRLLLGSLDGLDRIVLGRAKIKNEEKANNNMEKSSNLIAELLLKASRDTHSIKRNNMPVLGNDVEVGEIIEGELSIGSIDIDPNDLNRI